MLIVIDKLILLLIVYITELLTYTSRFSCLIIFGDNCDKK